MHEPRLAGASLTDDQLTRATGGTQCDAAKAQAFNSLLASFGAAGEAKVAKPGLPSLISSVKARIAKSRSFAAIDARDAACAAEGRSRY
jgi:hypothetical protein